MNETNPSESAPREEMVSALFTSLVIQQSSIAFLLLGRAPRPQSGKVERDLPSAKMFIDQLEMLETKTRGNLDRHEQALLKQSLMELHLAYVEAVQQSGTEAKAPAQVPAPAGPAAAPIPEPASTPAASTEPSPATAPASAATEDESKKKFSKKY